MRAFLFLLMGLWLSPAPLSAQQLRWELGPTGSKASLRGLWAVDDKIVWASGSDATVLHSEDGGSSWETCGPEGYGELEFRSIYAWDNEQAIIASAGTPAVILKTRDGGESWDEVFRHPDENAFFDGLRFWREDGAQKGIVFGDPVGSKQHLEVLETEDGGQTWKPVDPNLLPRVADGEAGFAASNSAMIVGSRGRVWIGTGATTAQRSRLHFRLGWGQPWRVSQVPMPSAEAAGIFSLALGPNRMLAVGGDYRPGAKSGKTVAMCDDGGGWWQPAQKPPAEFRSAVIYRPNAAKGLWIAVGPTGSDFSPYGNTWTQFSEQGFHVLARGGSTVFAAGADGRFAVLK